MIFKDGAQQQYAFIGRPAQSHGQRAIRGVARILDAFCQDILGDGEIIITSAVRPPNPNKKSFHPKGQAFDMRTKGKDRKLIAQVIDMLIFLRVKDPQIQHVWEDVGGDNEHLHVEYDTGDAV